MQRRKVVVQALSLALSLWTVPAAAGASEQGVIRLPASFGSAVSYSMCVDSGASKTFIHADTADALIAAGQAHPITIEGSVVILADGKSSVARLVTIDHTLVAGANVPALIAVVTPQRGDREEAGCLGMNFLSHFRFVKIDFVGRTVGFGKENLP
jgi:hypothetical protein